MKIADAFAKIFFYALLFTACQPSNQKVQRDLPLYLPDDL